MPEAVDVHLESLNAIIEDAGIFPEFGEELQIEGPREKFAVAEVGFKPTVFRFEFLTRTRIAPGDVALALNSENLEPREAIFELLAPILEPIGAFA
jgi:hypothetical protein